MMRVLFALIGCPYCHIASLAVTDFNKYLPIGKKIKIVDVLPTVSGGEWRGHPLLNVIQGVLNEPDMYNWPFPLLILDNPTIIKEFGTHTHGSKGRLLANSAYAHSHYFAFLKHYLEDTTS